MAALKPATRHQQGGVILLEFLWLLPVFMGLALLLIDLSRYMQYRERLQSTAFSLATVMSDPAISTIDDPANVDVDKAQTLLDELMRRVDTDLSYQVRQYYRDDAASAVVQNATIGDGCRPTAADVTMLAAKQAVYMVWVCNDKAWQWHSSGVLGRALSSIQGERFQGIAFMQRR